MNFPQPLALRNAANEWGGEMVVDMAHTQDGVAKGRSPVLVIRCAPALKVGNYR